MENNQIQNAGAGNQGFGNQGFGNQGFGNQGFGNQGFGNQGFGIQGAGNQGAGNQGFGNQGFGIQGAGNQGAGNQGIGIQGAGNQGAGNQGAGNQEAGSGERRFGKINNYMSSEAWLWAQVVEYFMVDLSNRLMDREYDPNRRHFDQLNMAARSISANIAEGLSRNETSSQTEMTLLDVARGSLGEVSSDLMQNSLRRCILIWSPDDPNYRTAKNLEMEAPRYGEYWMHDCQQYLFRQIEVLKPWFQNPDINIAFNTMALMVERLKRMVTGLNNRRYGVFKEKGGFSEQLSKERIEARNNQSMSEEGPRCPRCGAPMIKKLCKKGINHGSAFWGCSNYPNCREIINIK